MTRNSEQSPTLMPLKPGGLAEWNPLAELTSLRRQVDDLVARTLGYTPLFQLIPANGFNFEPPIEIKNLGDKVQIFVAVPGYKAEEIKVEATESIVQITGERKALTKESGSGEEKSWLSGESRFSIACTLPAEVDPNKTQATVHDGVLTLNIPTTERAKEKTVKVPVSQK